MVADETKTDSTMSDSIHPRGEELRNAVRWLSDRRDHSLQAINEAAVKFDLSPLDTEFLIRIFASSGDNEAVEKSDSE